MRSIADTIKRLNGNRDATKSLGRATRVSKLVNLVDFGTNPGNLLCRVYVPAKLEKASPLVVVLHGCTQTAAEYDKGAGWSKLAEEFGFVLLLPEQQRSNNPNLCFNWFLPEDVTREHGEVQSIDQMASTVIERFSIDPSRVFVTGLSAGGAMAVALLATYPERYAAGAIIAGLPYAIANNIPEAFDRMRGHGIPEGSELSALVRQASHHAGEWPSISVWHGNADKTVNPCNMEAIVAQWGKLHNVGHAISDETERNHKVRRWNNVRGKSVVEAHTIAHMGHGTPIKLSEPDSYGVAQPYILDVGISSTWHIADTWGLVGDKPSRLPDKSPEAVPVADKSRHFKFPERNVGGIIEDALRAAGLMK